MEHATRERPAPPHVHAPWVRALAGLGALALLAGAGAGLLGLLLDVVGASRTTYSFFYTWFWMTVLFAFPCWLGGLALCAFVRLAEIALGLSPGPPESPRARGEPLDWPRPVRSRAPS